MGERAVSSDAIHAEGGGGGDERTNSNGAELMTITLQITVIDPPLRACFSLQDKKNELSQEVVSNGEPIVFTVPIERDEAGKVSGNFAMGPPTGRFLYVCSGSDIGRRRAKIPLMNLPEGEHLAAQFAGKAKDGWPFCATVKPLGEGWKVLHRKGTEI